jgi:hypothetical protein
MRKKLAVGALVLGATMAAASPAGAWHVTFSDILVSSVQAEATVTQSGESSPIQIKVGAVAGVTEAEATLVARSPAVLVPVE